MNEWNTYEAFVIKRKSFEYEQEVRAVTLLPVPDSLETVLGKVAMLREQMNIEIIIIAAKGRSGIKKATSRWLNPRSNKTSTLLGNSRQVEFTFRSVFFHITK